MLEAEMLARELLLDLRNDAVFKLFFSKKENEPLLISFLEAVLEPPSPIRSVEILNPALDKNVLEEKLSILDLVIHLESGPRIDVEIQVAETDAFKQRILYYWAKLHQSQLSPGDDYTELAPTLSIAILNYDEFKGNPDQLHSVFELRERIRGELYLPDLQLHFLELKKYAVWKKKFGMQKQLSPQGSSLDQWTRLFLTQDRTEEDLQELRQEPMMKKAIKALEDLSQDPEARAIAEGREKARVNARLVLAATERRAREEGRVEGRAEGRAEGEVKGRAEGEVSGQSKATHQFVRQASAKGMSAQEIASMFELELEMVKKILGE